MRVLQLVHDFLPASVAGVEVYAFELSRALADAGVEVAVLHATRGPGLAQYSLQEGIVGGIRVFRLVQNYPYRPLDEATIDPQAERRFAQVLDAFAPDLVHVQHLWGWSAAVPAVAHAAGVGVVAHLHDHWPLCPSGGQRYHPDGGVCEDLASAPCVDCYGRFRSREGALERLAMRAARHLPPPLPPDLLHRAFTSFPLPAQALLKRINEVGGSRTEAAAPLSPAGRRQLLLDGLAVVDNVIAPSRDIAARMIDEGMEEDAILHVPNGTAMERAHEPLPGIVDPGRPLSLLFLGTAVPHKGVHVIAEAVSLVPGTKLIVHGADPPAAYRSRCAGDRVQFAGPLAREEVAAAIDRADVVCLPSLWPENAPLVLLEARARARPVLASRIGGIPESCDGLTLPAGDVSAWTRALRDLAGDRRRLAKLADSVRPPLSARDNASQVLDIYQAVRGRRARTHP